MSISVSRERDRSVVRVVGEVDLSGAASLRLVLAATATDPEQQVAVDLSRVTFMDCAGLGPLLEARAVAGVRLSLLAPAPLVSELLALAGLHGVFDAQDDAAAGEARGPETIPSRDRVERAKGLLMASHGCDAEQAGQLLSRVARAHDLTLADLVDAVIARHDDQPSPGTVDAAFHDVMADARDRGYLAPPRPPRTGRPLTVDSTKSD